MNVLLSVNPQYADAIMSGTKKYEFRRTIFKKKNIDRIYIYSNTSVKKIVGWFEVEKILEGTPQEIWEKCHKHGGISKKDYFDYFDGAQKAFSIKIKNVHKFSEPVDPYAMDENFTPPQSFYYTHCDFDVEIQDKKLNLLNFV